ncbi:MAG: serine/threonine-protein kinase [Persicimonas sp.]
MARTDALPAPGDGAEGPLPAHYCAECMSVVYRRDARCLCCGEPAGKEGWPRLNRSGDPWLGRVLGGRYLLTRRLGRGASAAVYQAESLTITRQFAIKIVDLSAGEGAGRAERARARFRREVEAVARLDHPHIASFFETLELSETCVAVVMKLVDGYTLDDLLASEGPLEWTRACELLRQMAAAVYAAHQAGLIHRDLKPANAMVQRLAGGEEFVYLLDFGIVWMADGVDVTRGFVGTPLYASPEQALGDEIDPRSDIYSLGAIAYKALTGCTPFTSDNVMDVLRQHIRRRPPPLQKRCPEARFPFALERLVEKMLAKSPEARPDDLGWVISQLDRILEREWVESAQQPTLPLDIAAAPPSDTFKGMGVIEDVVRRCQVRLGGVGTNDTHLADERDDEVGAVDSAPTIDTYEEISDAFLEAEGAEIDSQEGLFRARSSQQECFGPSDRP